MKFSVTLSIILAANATFTFTTQATQVTIKNLFAVEISDWNNDGSMDKAVLARSENKNNIDNDDGAVLYIYLSNDHQGTLITKKNIAWAGALWGTTPTLSLNKSGSLLIHSMNESIGRNRWNQKLTLSYRNNKFIVSGYNYASYDTLVKDSQFTCDVNLLTGKGKLNDKTFHIAKQKIALEDWNEKLIPKKCLE